MPILLAVSPFAAMRSAPTTMASTRPEAISAAAAESAIRLDAKPSTTSSYAVRRDPARKCAVRPHAELCADTRCTTTPTPANRKHRARTTAQTAPDSSHPGCTVVSQCSKHGSVRLALQVLAPPPEQCHRQQSPASRTILSGHVCRCRFTVTVSVRTVSPMCCVVSPGLRCCSASAPATCHHPLAQPPLPLPVVHQRRGTRWPAR